MMKEIRAGAPGGKRFAPLSMIARRGRDRQPLRRFAGLVRYWLASRDPVEMHVGFTGRSLGQSWQNLITRHQAGFTSEMRPERRMGLIRAGFGYGKRSSYRKYHMLRKSTRVFRTPARPIIDPFWAAHAGDAWRNLRSNFIRKMRGERI